MLTIIGLAGKASFCNLTYSKPANTEEDVPPLDPITLTDTKFVFFATPDCIPPIIAAMGVPWLYVSLQNGIEGKMLKKSSSGGVIPNELKPHVALP